jgi:glycerol-3-phosphate acyltransferase PlsX
MHIALDAMGGDHAPGVVVQGAVQAARQLPHTILLVGDQARIRPLLAQHKIDSDRITLVHAGEVVEMHEHTMAVKEKKDASMNVAARLVRDGEADAFVSAGNSGAVLAASLFQLGRIRGISRPALGIVYPGAPNLCVLIDIGAITDPKPEMLLHNALMGVAYAERVLGLTNPRVAIVSNGEEPDKGSEVVREAYKLLSASALNFVGNVEGKDIGRGAADVVVTDGFTGNVIVKLSEGLVSFLARHIRREFTGGALNKLALALMLPGVMLALPGALLMVPAVQRLLRKVDYAEYGGALLLGVEGVVIIAHGRSNAKAIANSVRVAAQAVESGMLDAIKAGLTQRSAALASDPAVSVRL